MVGEEASCVVDCKYINTRVTFRAGDETFTYAFRTIQNPGFYALYKSYEEEEDEEEEKEYIKVTSLFSRVDNTEPSTESLVVKGSDLSTEEMKKRSNALRGADQLSDQMSIAAKKWLCLFGVMGIMQQL